MKRQSAEPNLTDLDSEALQRLALAARERSRKAGRRHPGAIPIIDRAGKLPLSFAQQQLWLVSQLDGVSTNYHLDVVLRLQGELDLAAWRRSLDRLLGRHEALRTIFMAEHGEPQVQLLPPDTVVPLSWHDLRARPDREQRFRELLEECRGEPFDLACGPLIRSHLIRLDDDVHAALLSLHHIVSDGWSMGVIVRELSALYTAFAAGEGDPLPPLALQYPDFAAWQRKALTQQKLKRQLDHWTGALAGAPPMLTLPTDRPRTVPRSIAGAAVPVEIGGELSGAIRQLGRMLGATPFVIVLSAWAIVLSRLAGQLDLVIGTPTANRTVAQLEGLVGFFANMLAVRLDLTEAPSVAELVERVKKAVLAAQDHQDLPFEHLVEALQPPRNPDHTPIFQVVFAWQSNDVGELALPGIDVVRLAAEPRQIKFDLELDLSETAGGISGRLNYATALFDEATVLRQRNYLMAALRAMVTDVGQSVQAIELLSGEERSMLLDHWNRTDLFTPPERCIQDLIADQVHRWPAAVALVHDGVRLTYRELDTRANRLAHHLLEHGAAPDRLVAICQQRGIDAIVSLLAVLKAGAAYLPLDPVYPAQRLREILADAEPVLLLCDNDGAAKLGDVACPVLDVKRHAPKWHDMPDVAPVIAGLTPRHLAYVIYTSGSTGKPKGVMIEHRGLVNLALAQIALFEIKRDSRVVQFASFSFDASVWDIVMALCSGAELHLIGGDAHRDASVLFDYFADHRITHATLPPAMLQGRPDLERLAVLETLVLAGELPKAELIAALPLSVAVFNAYGPTEATVCATAWRRPAGFVDGAVPIGRPIANARIYLLDDLGGPVPRGAVGEIWIGGAGVARGYLNRVDLTAERFATDPFASGEDARMYRTGDLGRYRPDGDIEFLGRNDHQVKIRGFRIELGEIEARLAALDGVRDSAVLARRTTHGDTTLTAYVVPAEGVGAVGPWSAQLRAHLQACLPDYMVPSAILCLPALPLTPNGKVDRNAVPAPDDGAFSRRTYAAPQGEREFELAAIWSELLGIDRIGRNDHFFELGGQSLLIVRLLDRLQRRGFTTNARTVFVKPVLHELAASLHRLDEVAIPENLITERTTTITPEMLPLIALNQSEIDRVVDQVPGGVANIQDIYALSPLQEGIMFHHLLATEGDPYVLVAQMAFPSRDLLDRYLAAVQQVIDRHDVLRTSIVWDGPSVPVQVVWRRAQIEVTEVALDGHGPAHLELAKRFDPRSSRIDLSKAPLLRFAVARDPAGERMLLLVLLHHMIGDHATLEAINREVEAMMSGCAHLLPAPTPFRNLVARSRDAARRDAEQRFFRGMLADIDAPTAPFGLLDVRSDGDSVREAKLAIPSALDARARTQARRLGVSLASLCHLAWAQVLARSSGREQIVFGTVLFGRMQTGAGLDRSLGLFINTLPLRLDLDETSVETSVRVAHARLAELTMHEHASLAMAQRCSGVAPPAPLFSAILNYRHSRKREPEAVLDSPLHAVEWLGAEERTNYPLMLAVDDDGDALRLTAQTAAAVTPHRICAMMRRCLDQLVSALETDPHMPVCRVDVIPAGDRAQLLEAWNATAKALDRPCVPRQFEAQAARRGDAIALIHGDETISYGELNARANRLASRLRTHGIGADVVVGLALERSITMMVALLAVLKAGGAYLPLDPDYPAERLAHMLGDSGAKLLLTQAALLDRFAPALRTSGAEAWLLDTESGDGHDANLDLEIHPESLAYVIYTSGSTGLPKGVMVRHGAVTNFLATMAEQPGIARDDRVLGLTSLSFDIAVLELWLPLTHGAQVVLADRTAAHDPAVLKAMVARHGVTMIQATPSSWRMLLDHDETTDWLPGDGRVLSGGEALAPDLARRLTALSREVWNLYGPTETTVWSARHRLDAAESQPMLGGPIGNTTLYVLDGHLNLAPVGVTGELFIGGAGLARGYWQRASLSAERFIPDPFGADGARLYRTGDLARWRADGVLDHVGRADHQVKIRGHRIELGEIEARLREQPGVRDSVVVARELGGSRQLVGYVSGEDALDGASLRAALVPVLPDYMVPSRVMVLPQLPLTPNGKIDRKALPQPDARPSERARVAPRNPTEAALAAIWADLLHQDEVGVTENFFELGGDSIISLQVVSRARRAGLVIEPRDVFRHQTIELLAHVSRAMREDKRTAVVTRGVLAGLTDDELARLGLDEDRIEDFYPLSPMQQGMLFHSLRDAGSGVYVNQISVEIRGLSVERLRSAWQEVSARHPMLRTGFLWRELSGSPLQAVYRHTVVPFETEDWRGQAVDEARLSAALAGERDAEFDLARPPLQRVRLLQVEDQCHRLIWTYHHILMDGWSSARFLREVLDTYAGRQLGPGPSHYRDYIAWLVAQDATKAERFWRGQLAEFDEPTQLADAFGGRRHQVHGHLRCSTRLDESATTALKAFARRERVTLNTLIQGVWALLLQRYTGQQTVTFGVTVAGRPADLDGVEQMIGLFINTLPMIETPPPASAIGDWLRAMQSRSAAIRNHEQTPLYDIQSWAGRAGEPMFDSIIVFENYPVDRGLVGDGSLRFAGLRNVDVTNYPMDLSVMVDDTLQVEFTYMPSHFTSEQAERIRAQFEHLLAALTHDSAVLLGALDQATSQDLAYARASNAHAVPAASAPLVHEAISRHALIDPERTALTIAGDSLSYGALERRANRLAHHLIALGLAPDQRVAVVVERTEATMLALLAVLKAGGAYVPLDPELPPERIAYVLRDSGALFLLSGARDVAAPNDVSRVDLGGFDFESGPDHSPQPRLHPENVAYVIYTSGSTGRPKGVAVAHGPLAMHCRATAALYQIDDRSCELHFLSLAFDGAHERWLTVLSHGARLVMRDAELWTPEQTVETARAHGVTHLGLPPAYLQQVADWVEQSGNPPPVRLYSFGGEAMPKAGFDKVKRTLKPQILINGYGPTETVVTPLVWKVDGSADCDKAYAPIGVPVGSRTAYILDGQLNLIPAGAAGELYIGGAGLARGYHAKPGLTAERFLPDPFSSAPGARLYRTGDLARWDADGVIEYLGRGDDQVKVSGFRIELGEIQSALSSEQAVAQAAVLAMPGVAGNQLIAYVAPRDARNAVGASAERLSASLVASLRRSLPAYMLPARIIVLDHLPTLSSGKVDRKALPAPDAAAARTFIAPESPAEIAMARLWADVLGVPQVGVTDNFFELGGNSILSLKVIARLRREPILGGDIKLRDLLQKPTIRALLGAPASPPKRPSALLPLNAPVSGIAPVFCVHGGFGTVFDYAPLARRMEGRRQLVGVQCRTLIDPSFADPSLTAMAAGYADEIMEAQDSGPYHLIGWSLGGLIACLVAAELERRGKEVASLGLIDSFVPDPQRRAERRAEKYWTDELLGLLSVAAPGAQIATIRSQAAALRDAGAPETDEAIRHLIASAIATTHRQARDRLLGMDDIVAAFRVGRHLKRLAYEADWPAALFAEPACWWTSGRLEQRDVLEARLTAAVDLGVLGDDHFAILANDAFLSSIWAWLEPVGAAQPVQAPQSEPAE